MQKFSAFIGGVALGTVLGLSCAFVQADRSQIGRHTIAYGVFISWTLIVISQLWLSRRWQSRLPSIGIALGWVAMTTGMHIQFGNHEKIIVDTWWSNLYLFGSGVILGCVCALPTLKPVPEINELPEPFTDVMNSQIDTRAEQDNK
jgi:hypothetical protein